MKKTAMTSICMIIAFLSIMLFLVLASTFSKQELAPQPFNQELWNEDPFQRISMIEDLEKNYNLKSMTKNEVLELLGNNSCGEGEHVLVYIVEYNKQELPSMTNYMITFDEDGYVKRTRVYKDY